MTKEEKQAWLEKQHTKQLLDLLKGCYRCGGSYNPFGYGDNFTMEEIQAVLATREHIPNKQEARKIRQEKAMKG